MPVNCCYDWCGSCVRNEEDKCVKCCCFCGPNNSWISLRNKGACWIPVIILGYFCCAIPVLMYFCIICCLSTQGHGAKAYRDCDFSRDCMGHTDNDEEEKEDNKKVDMDVVPSDPQQTQQVPDEQPPQTEMVVQVSYPVEKQSETTEKEPMLGAEKSAIQNSETEEKAQV